MGHYIHPVTAQAKRAMDILGALTGIILTLPLWPLIALAIKWESPGPVFFRQQRVGRIYPDYIEFFYMIKFRSMRQDAETKTGAVWATKMIHVSPEWAISCVKPDYMNCHNLSMCCKGICP